MNVRYVILLGLLLLATAWLTGCGSESLDGTYTPNGEQTYTYDQLKFSPDGTFSFVFNGGAIQQRTYSMADHQVQLHINQSPHNLTMREDGCLVGNGESGMHGVYC